jgi:hypothetical protein
MKRQHQLLLIASTLGFSWLAMQAVHELGHILAAWATGGRIADVKLHPAAISYTMLSVNPHPLFVAWMGPLIGTALPMLAWLIARFKGLRGWYILQFFAAFCLVANGAYLAGGALYDMGDAAELLRFDASYLQIGLFSASAMFVGFWLWNGLGTHFGLEGADGRVDRTVAYVVTWFLFAIVAIELMFTVVRY